MPLPDTRPASACIDALPPLVLALASTSIDGATQARARSLLGAETDWDALLAAAARHQVMPLVASHLAREFSPWVPPAVASKLRAALKANAARNLFLAGELVQVMRLLDAHGVAALAYKGPLLAAGVYGDIALRSFGDVDILVHRFDYQFMVPRILEAHGWNALPDQDFERSFRKGDVALDVHWTLTPQRSMPLALRFGAMWRRAAELELPHGKVTTFAAEDLLVALCVQLAKDSAEVRRSPALIKVCDIAELVRRLRPEGHGAVVARARRLGVARILRLGVAVANDLLASPVPARFAPRRRERRALDALVGHVRGRILGGEHVAAVRAEWLEPAAWNDVLRERARDRLRIFREVRHHALSPSVADFGFVGLPRALWPLYPLVRPVRLIGRHGSQLLDRVRQRAGRAGDG